MMEMTRKLNERKTSTTNTTQDTTEHSIKHNNSIEIIKLAKESVSFFSMIIYSSRSDILKMEREHSIA